MSLTLEKLKQVRAILTKSTPNSELYYVHLRQYRFPRSKKRRIRNKWSNDLRNYCAIPCKGAELINT